MNWLDILQHDGTRLDEFIDLYETRMAVYKKSLAISDNIISDGRKLPEITDEVYSDFQIVQAVYELFDMKTKMIRSSLHKQYLTKFQIKLTSRDAERFVEGEPTYVDAWIILNKVNLLRNRLAGVTKGLECKHYQITNIAKLRAAGIEF